MFKKGYNFPLAVFAFAVEGFVLVPMSGMSANFDQLDFLQRRQLCDSTSHTQPRVGADVLANCHSSIGIPASGHLLLNPHGVGRPCD
jgi:hypothetical protein